MVGPVAVGGGSNNPNLIEINNTVANSATPGTAIGSVSAIDPANGMAWVKLNAGGFGTFQLANLVQFFTPGWYRRPDNPFNPLAGQVMVAYRATIQAYPDFSVSVTVSDS